MVVLMNDSETHGDDKCDSTNGYGLLRHSSVWGRGKELNDHEVN